MPLFLFLLLLVLLLSTMLFGMEYQLESAVLALSSPNLLSTPSLLAFRAVGGCWRHSLDAVGAVPRSSQSTFV